MTVVKATTEEIYEVGETYNHNGAEHTILSASVGEKLTKLEVSEEGATDVEIAKAITIAQELENLTVTTQSGKEFYANSTARIDLLSAINASESFGVTEKEWKLTTGKEVVSIAEIKEANLLAIQVKGELVLK